MPRSPELIEFVTDYDISLGDTIFDGVKQMMAVDYYEKFGIQIVAIGIVFSGVAPKVFLQEGALSTDFNDMVDSLGNEAALSLDAGDSVNTIRIIDNVMPQVRARFILNNGSAGTITLRIHKLGQGL